MQKSDIIFFCIYLYEVCEEVESPAVGDKKGDFHQWCSAFMGRCWGSQAKRSEHMHTTGCGICLFAARHIELAIDTVQLCFDRID
jgi:hypothetical protein